ncbi:hypothetical protein TNCV_3381371 [Trichonephila clavipes]|nr:hypothetical protein TNCV_3381371 [Trichonephila clavipes]
MTRCVAQSPRVAQQSDITGCNERDAPDWTTDVGENVAALMIARPSRKLDEAGASEINRFYRAYLCLWDTLILGDDRLSLPRSIVSNTEQLPYRSDRGGGRYACSTNLLL